jgi:hypothetical protein
MIMNGGEVRIWEEAALLYPRDGTGRRLAGRAVPLGVSSGCLRAAT